MPQFSQLEKDIVRVLAEHVARNEEISLTELAGECHVAKSTVVKAVQKLGYRGFGDLSYTVRLNAKMGGNLLPASVVEGDMGATAYNLAHLFSDAREAHNLIFSGDKRTSAPIASYMSRKLAMFDIFASSSYDYAMALRSAQGASREAGQGDFHGFAIFCFHKETRSRKEWGQQTGFGESMLDAARSSGFTIVIFSDDESKVSQIKADMIIRITANKESDMDLYVPKVLMVFETSLSWFAQGGSGGE